jgi:hypothetical protein
MVEAIQRSILAKYQASVGHMIELSVVGNIRRVSPILDNKCRSNIPSKTWKVLKAFHALSTKTNFGMVKAIQWPIFAQYQASSGHLIELSIVGNITWVSPILDNTCCSNIPTKTWKVLQPFLALSKTDFEMVEVIQWGRLAQYQASSGHLIQLSIVGNVRPVSPIFDNTCRSNIQSKTWKVLQPFHALSKKPYFGMVEAI